jgi:hypothetical protein
MKLFDRKKARRERALAAVDKMIADKRAVLDCVQQGKPLSTLKEKGIVIVKFQTIP